MTGQGNFWKKFQELMGYSDEEMERFKADPKKTKTLTELRKARKRKIIAEVIKSHGCASGHKVGDKFVISVLTGCLISEECPRYMCIHALQPLAICTVVVQDRIVAGLDPNEMVFDTWSCSDSGFDCGGWGQISLKVYVV
nr:hypothetical protein [Desulfobacterales bacterium]